MSISDYIQLFRSHRPMRYGKRLIIAEELYGADGYADGDMLWQSLRVRGIRVSQATVYDALNWLVSEGIAVKKAGVNKRNLYMIGQDFRQFVQSDAALSSR